MALLMASWARSLTSPSVRHNPGVEPKPAATVIVARDAPRGIEVAVLRRSAGTRFAPGFVVFPGGAVELADEPLAGAWFGDEREAPRACAIRELGEETGLVLTGSGLRPLRRSEPGRWSCWSRTSCTRP